MVVRAPHRSAFPIPFDRAEISRRLGLAWENASEHVSRPRLRTMLAETRYILEPVRRPLRHFRNPFVIPPSSQPRMVMVLPGFATHPVRMRYFARSLEKAGHTVKRWGLGFNWGPSAENFAILQDRLDELHAKCGEKIHLVGWSLGGVIARELARAQPDKVAQVITMGSPFSYSPRANNAWRMYQFVAGHRVEEPPIAGDVSIKPPVFTTAMWSPNDGIVHRRSACGKPSERDRAVALRCGHLGFAYSDEAILAVVRELERV